MQPAYARHRRRPRASPRVIRIERSRPRRADHLTSHRGSPSSLHVQRNRYRYQLYLRSMALRQSTRGPPRSPNRHTTARLHVSLAAMQHPLPQHRRRDQAHVHAGAQGRAPRAAIEASGVAAATKKCCGGGRAWVSVSAASTVVVFSGAVRLGELRSRAYRCSRGHRPSGCDTGATGRRVTLPQRHRRGVGGSLTQTPRRRAYRLQRPCSLPIISAYVGSA